MSCLERSKKGLLRLLPVPDRFHRELTIDFMIDLSAKTKSDPKYMMVVVDRLRGSVAIEEMTTMRAQECTKALLKFYVRYHGFPSHIISDRGSNWVGDF